jgi:hypothetical protein
MVCTSINEHFLTAVLGRPFVLCDMVNLMPFHIEFLQKIHQGLTMIIRMKLRPNKHTNKWL